MKNQNLQSMGMNEYGKLPPQAIDLERKVIGSILTDSNAIFFVNGILSAEMFYKNEHQLIFDACMKLNRINATIDPFTVSNLLKESGNLEQAGGIHAIVEIGNEATFSNIEYHAKIIVQFYLKRQIIQLCSRAVGNSFDDTKDIFEIIDEISDQLRDLSNHLLEDSKETWQQSTENYVIDLQDRIQKGVTETGIKVGLKQVDKTVAGFRAGLYIIAGRPSMGKSAFGFELACRIAEQKIGKVGIFSLEMSRNQLINRIVARYSNIDQTRLINGNLHQGEINQLINGGSKASELDFFINDKSGISINQIMSKAKVWAHKNKLSCILVDYIQLVKGSNKERRLEIGEISRGLKILSKDLDIPVIALAQLGREKDGGKSFPKMSELKESSDIEQDADCVMLLYRPEYYKIEYDNEGKSTKGLTIVIIEKNRNGPVNVNGAHIRSNLAINRYEDWDQEINMPHQEEKRENIRVNNGRDDEDFSPF